MKSKLENHVQSEKFVPISEDSVKKYTKTITIDSIICKVPQEKLSQFLRNLDGKYTQLNLREISLEDVTQEYILGENQNKTSRNFSNKIDKALKDGGELQDKIEAIQTLKNYEDEKNNNHYIQANLNNDVKYSTVEIEIIEPEKYNILTLANNTKYDKADSPFWFKVKESFHNGYELLRKCLIALASIWPVLLIVILLLFFRFRKRKK